MWNRTTSPVARTWAATAKAPTHATTVKPTVNVVLARGGATAPATEAATPSSADAMNSPVIYVPASPRSARTIEAGSGGQPGISRSTGRTSPTAPSTP